MEPIFLLDLASRKSAWLAARQATVAGNIANVNTPGYRTKELASFSDVVDRTKLDLASTNVGHIALTGVSQTSSQMKVGEDAGFETTESGNSVGIEQEMLKAGEVNRDYAMTTNIVKSFHAMLMASLKE